MKKGSHLSKETKLLLSIALRKKWQEPDFRKNLVAVHKERPTRYWLGKKRDKKTKEKISKSRQGIPAWNKGLGIFGQISKENIWKWKGDKAGYTALHKWIREKLGTAYRCETCGLDKLPEGKKRYFDWANISHKYRRDLKDWKQLCRKCHRHFDAIARRKANQKHIRSRPTTRL